MELFSNPILLILFIVYCICWIIAIKDALLRLVPTIKCRKVMNCKKDDCPFRGECEHIAYTDKEAAEIRALIARLK